MHVYVITYKLTAKSLEFCISWQIICVSQTANPAATHADSDDTCALQDQ